VDLGDRAVSAPTGTHLTPVEDVFFYRWRELHDVISVVSVKTEITDNRVEVQACILY
jgi:hypothetical protein